MELSCSRIIESHLALCLSYSTLILFVSSFSLDFCNRFYLQYKPDAGDESLQRYKESLGLGGGGKDLSDPNDPRHCIILSLTMDSAGRDSVTIDLSRKGAEKTLKDKPFKIKEGVKFTMTAKFKVQHEILSGLHYVQVVKRKGVRVSKDQEMIVSFPNPRCI